MKRCAHRVMGRRSDDVMRGLVRDTPRMMRGGAVFSIRSSLGDAVKVLRVRQVAVIHGLTVAQSQWAVDWVVTGKSVGGVRLVRSVDGA